MTATGTRHALIIDDDPLVGQSIKAMLSQLSVEAVIVDTGTEALIVAADRPFDIIFCDIIMPDLDGFSIIERLFALGVDAPVVAMSGGGRVDAGEYLNWINILDVRATLRKPFGRKDLTQVVDQVLGGETP
ncbi:MAG: response regulator [Azospirillaceae bacterium]